MDGKDGGVASMAVTSRARDVCACSREAAVEWYCNSHGVIMCGDCRNVEHRKCETASLTSAASGVFESGRYLQAVTDLERLLENFKYVSSAGDRLTSTLEENKNRLLTEMKELKSAMIAAFERMENEVLQGIHEQIDKKTEEKQRREATCQSVIESLETRLKQLGKPAGDNMSELAAFTVLPKIMTENSKHEQLLEELKKESETIEMTLKTNKILDNFIECKNVVGTLKTTKTKYTLELPYQTFTKMQATHVCDIDVKAPVDMAKSWITGICMLPDGRLLAADHYNQSIKLFSKDNKLVATADLKCHPWDIAVTGENEACCTLPEEGMIRYLSVSPGSAITLGKCVVVGKDCKGLAVCGSKLIVTYEPSGKCVKILDKQGNVERTIDKDSDGKELFAKPLYVTSHDESILYVTDNEKHIVTMLNLLGKVLYTYSGGKTNYPCGVAVDEIGQVFVGVSRLVANGMVVALSPDRVRSRDVSGTSGRSCQAVYFNPELMQLFVSSYWTTEPIKRFQL